LFGIAEMKLDLKSDGHRFSRHIWVWDPAQDGYLQKLSTARHRGAVSKSMVIRPLATNMPNTT
jgi:hypothetical protein